MILCGAIPVYVNPVVLTVARISRGCGELEKAIRENPEAKGDFRQQSDLLRHLLDLASITELAHAHGMLADEAHGTHFYFK